LPSRVTVIGIFAFWCLSLGWFVRKELAPTWGASHAPPYAIELADEAIRQAVPVVWTVHRNGEFLTTATTRVEYVEPDDTFRLSCEIRKFDLVAGRSLAVTVNDLRNVYRVSRAGELLAMQTDVAVTAGGSRFDLMMSAEVKDGRAWTRCAVRSPWGSFEPTPVQVNVSASGMLNPLHPVQRVRGLRPGQRWSMPLVDPLADALRVALERFVQDTLGGPRLRFPGPRTLVAEVTGPRGLEWNGREHDCYVIEYGGDDYRAATWVRVRDGLVLRQEAGSNGDEFVLQRN